MIKKKKEDPPSKHGAVLSRFSRYQVVRKLRYPTPPRKDGNASEKEHPLLQLFDLMVNVEMKQKAMKPFLAVSVIILFAPMHLVIFLFIYVYSKCHSLF